MSTKKNNRGKFMRVSTDLLDMIDFNKPCEMQLAMTLLYKGQAMQNFWDNTIIETTPSLLIKAFGNYKDISRGYQTNVVNALIDMRDRGLISFDGDIKFKDEIMINAKPLLDLAQQGKTYVELLVKDFYTIMRTDGVITVNNEQLDKPNGLESLLLQTFLVAKARWNFTTIDDLAEVDDFGYAFGSYKDVQEAEGAFCSDTLDFMRTHKHWSLDEVEAWCDDRYLKAYLDKLEELGCIKIYSRKMKSQDGIFKTRNFYYIPTMKFDCIEAMAGQYARRNDYAIKERDKAEQPTQPIEQPKKTSRVNRGRSKNWFED